MILTHNSKFDLRDEKSQDCPMDPPRLQKSRQDFRDFATNDFQRDVVVHNCKFPEIDPDSENNL